MTGPSSLLSASTGSPRKVMISFLDASVMSSLSFTKLTLSMLLSELLLTEKRAQPVIVYHGTSSTFLRSILKNGLQSEPQEKVWQDDPQASSMSTTRQSYGGVYFTGNLMTATSSSTNATRKFKGNPLFIIASIVPESALPDEDEFRYILDGILGRHFGPSDINARFYAAWLSVNPSSPKVNDLIKQAFEEFTRNDKAKGVHPSYEVFKNVITTMLTRIAAYDYQANKNYAVSQVVRGFEAAMREKLEDHEDWYDREKSDALHSKISKESYEQGQEWLKGLNPAELEKQTMKAIDTLVRRHKSHTKNIRTQRNYVNIRSMKNIGFSGRNRIIGIVEELGYKEDRTIRFMVRYGTVPDDFLTQVSERRGPFVIEDRDGNVIINRGKEQ